MIGGFGWGMGGKAGEALVGESGWMSRGGVPLVMAVARGLVCPVER